MNTLMIYGALGYTGRMVAQKAKAAGLDVVIAGRDEQRLAALALDLDVPYRVFSLDGDLPPAHFEGIHTVLNCAGPFVRTAKPLMQACLEHGMYYLDITAEIGVYQLAESLSGVAADANVMLMPGVGWDVVPTDSLAVQVVGRVKDPVSLRIALKVEGGMSRGSAVSASEIVSAGILARVDGKLVSRPDTPSALFDFGDGPVDCFPLSFGDLVTAWHATGVRNIAMYVHVTGDGFPEGDLSLLPDGPTAEQRDAHGAAAVVEVISADGSVTRAIIETINGYSYTPLAAVEAARRVLEGDSRPGFQTPASVFGQGFAETIEGTSVTHLP
jgi:short subunit dehydrogenase-like uncharacterized protein